MRTLIRYLALTVLVLVASRGAAQDSSASALQQDTQSAFEISSPVFADKGVIPPKYACRGANVNPPLVLRNLPEGTKSLVLSMHDPNGISGVWVHWVVFNISPDRLRIGENSVPGAEALNDFGNYYYSGPCPADDEKHNYIFTIYALKDYLREANEGDTLDTLEKMMAGKIIAQARLTGTYENPKWDQR